MIAAKHECGDDVSDVFGSWNWRWLCDVVGDVFGGRSRFGIISYLLLPEVVPFWMVPVCSPHDPTNMDAQVLIFQAPIFKPH